MRKQHSRRRSRFGWQKAEYHLIRAASFIFLLLLILELLRVSLKGW